MTTTRTTTTTVTVATSTTIASHTNNVGASTLSVDTLTKLNSMALVRERTIPTERSPPVGEVSANFCG